MRKKNVLLTILSILTVFICLCSWGNQASAQEASEDDIVVQAEGGDTELAQVQKKIKPALRPGPDNMRKRPSIGGPAAKRINEAQKSNIKRARRQGISEEEP